MNHSFISSRLLVGRKHREEPIIREMHNMKGDKFDWTDMQNPDRGEIEELAKRYGLNHLNVEDCMTKFELPKLDGYGDHFFALLHFPPINDRMSRHSQLSVFVGRNFLITIHHGDLKPLLDIRGAFQDGADPERRSRLVRSPGHLLHEIIDMLVDDLSHTARKITANLDDIEDGVFDESKSVAKGISRLRREINTVRRVVNPLKRLVIEMGEKIKKSESGALDLYFDDVIDHIDKVIESLEESRETMEIYKDTDFMLSTEKTNRVLAVLTVIFTLFMPATVIGTFYGMNVGLPSLDDGQTYNTFVVIIAISAIPAVLMVAYFKRAGWMSG